MIHLQIFIEFTNLDTDEVIKVQVIKINVFKTFKELFDYYDKSYLGNEKMKYKDMYDYYTKEEESEYGVVGIEIKLLGE